MWGAGAPGWRIEDTGELLSIDAKERADQGLSRLLNAVDGLHHSTIIDINGESFRLKDRRKAGVPFKLSKPSCLVGMQSV